MPWTSPNSDRMQELAKTVQMCQEDSELNGRQSYAIPIVKSSRQQCSELDLNRFIVYQSVDHTFR